MKLSHLQIINLMVIAVVTAVLIIKTIHHVKSKQKSKTAHRNTYQRR